MDVRLQKSISLQGSATSGDESDEGSSTVNDDEKTDQRISHQGEMTGSAEHEGDNIHFQQQGTAGSGPTEKS